MRCWFESQCVHVCNGMVNHAQAMYADTRAASQWRACGRAARRVVALAGSRAPELYCGALLCSSTEIRPGVLEDEHPWQHGHNYRCERCGRGGELILCDFCNVVYHLSCLEPPLAEAPAGLWRCPQCAAERSAPVIGAVAARAVGRGEFMCTGGYRLSSFTHFSDVYECSYDANSADWTRIETAGAPATGFCGASAAFDDASAGTLRVFSRLASPGPLATRRERSIASAATFEAVYTLIKAQAAYRWIRDETTGETPSPRSDCALCDAGDRLFLFAGFSPEHKRHLDGLHVLYKSEWSWRCLHPDTFDEDAVHEETQHQLPRDMPPLEQEVDEPAEQAQPAHDESDDGHRIALSLVFNLRRTVSATRRYADYEPPPKQRASNTSRKRTVRRQDSSKPGPRAGHTLTRIGSTIWLFGGLGPRGNIIDYHDDVWTLDSNLAAWKREMCAGTLPRGRAAHSASAIGPHVIVFGGLNAQRFLADIFVLHTPSRCWSAPSLEIAPSPRTRPAMVLPERHRPDDPHLLIFGGTRAWGAASATPTSTTRHDGDLFALTFSPNTSSRY